MRALLLLILAAAACTQPRSARCKQVCTRESECVGQAASTMPFDEKECVAACAVLESDPDNLAKVEHHAECVAKQTTCPAVLDCP